jgi:hypothetical protein
MLERVKAEGDHRRRRLGAPDAEHAAFLAQFVVIERMGGQHVESGPVRFAVSPAPI